MKRYFAFFFVIFFLVILQGCYNQGSSAPAPTNVSVVAGDTSATVSWDMLPGVEYWVFKAAGTDITPLSCFGLPQCQMIMKANSPAVVTGLTNGTTYSFTINGRIDGGKGGPGSPSVQAVPRLAGAAWRVAATAGTYDLRAVTYGAVFVAAGVNGALFTSSDGNIWSVPASSPQTTATLNAASYYGGKYVVVGAGGKVFLSSDAVTWDPPTSAPLATQDLYAVSNYSTAGYIATGAGGTIIYSDDGKNWISATSVTTNPLYGVTYGSGKYIAVGASGILLTSTDGKTWSNLIASNTANTLNAVAYAPSIGTTGTGTFVAVGANATIVVSTDGGVSWAPLASTSPFTSATAINSVTYGRQFVAVANDGKIFTSTDGMIWVVTTSSPVNSTALFAVTHGLYDYTAVGASGLNMHSK